MKISHDEIHLWYACDEQIDDPGLLSRYFELLSEEEKSQQKRYYFEKHRHQYLISRSLVRTVLSQYAEQTPPHKWGFEQNRYGKPYIRHPEQHQWLRFNISHSEKLVVMAVVANLDVGVDVEYINRSGNMLKIAERFFSQSEMQQLLSLPADCRNERFYDLWTLGESYIKACGMGLSIPLDHFSFSFPIPGEIGIEFAPERCDQSDYWQFWLIRPNATHNISLALKSGRVGDAHRLTMRKITPLSEIVKVNHPIASKSKRY